MRNRKKVVERAAELAQRRFGPVDAIDLYAAERRARRILDDLKRSGDAPERIESLVLEGKGVGPAYVRPVMPDEALFIGRARLKAYLSGTHAWKMILSEGVAANLSTGEVKAIMLHEVEHVKQARRSYLQQHALEAGLDIAAGGSGVLDVLHRGQFYNYLFVDGLNKIPFMAQVTTGTTFKEVAQITIAVGGLAVIRAARENARMFIRLHLHRRMEYKADLNSARVMGVEPVAAALSTVRWPKDLEKDGKKRSFREVLREAYSTHPTFKKRLIRLAKKEEELKRERRDRIT